MEAPVGVVGLEMRVVQLARLDDHQLGADVLGGLAGLLVHIAGLGGTDADAGQNVLRPQRIDRGLEQIAAIHAAGIGDDHPAKFFQDLLQRFVLVFEIHTPFYVPASAIARLKSSWTPSFFAQAARYSWSSASPCTPSTPRTSLHWRSEVPPVWRNQIKFQQDDILRGDDAEVSLGGFAQFQLPAAGHHLLLEFAGSLDEDIDLERGLEVDHVEAAMRPQCLLHRLPADVELIFEEFIEACPQQAENGSTAMSASCVKRMVP